MAQVRPIRIDPEIASDPFRSAEMRVYDVCRNLPERWHVLYNVSWIARSSESVPASDGEADFVLIGPGIGIIVIEVKGGGIGRDSQGWYSVNRRGERFPISDPVEQVKRGKYNFLTMIKFEFYQMSSQGGQSSEMLGGCLDYPIPPRL